jgi:hypothetical protein
VRIGVLLRPDGSRIEVEGRRAFGSWEARVLAVKINPERGLVATEGAYSKTEPNRFRIGHLHS